MVTIVPPQTTAIETLVALVDDAWARQEPLVSQLGPALAGGIDPGGWTARQVLSHLIGSWQRVPIHAGFYLGDDDSVPIVLHTGDPYWIAEWQTAPLASFLLALRAAVEGNRAFLRQLDPAVLDRSRVTPFGARSLQQLLTGSYHNHLGRFHDEQLRAFVAAQRVA